MSQTQNRRPIIRYTNGGPPSEEGDNTNSAGQVNLPPPLPPASHNPNEARLGWDHFLYRLREWLYHHRYDILLGLVFCGAGYIVASILAVPGYVRLPIQIEILAEILIVIFCFSYRRAFSSFLQSCAGANPRALELAPTERNRYSFYGITVLLAAAVSACSFSYVALTAFGPQTMLPLAVLWGVFIFNTDRGIILGLRRLKRPTPVNNPVPPPPAGSVPFFRSLLNSLGHRVSTGFANLPIGEVVYALPRISLGFLLAFTISRPIEMRFAESEIKTRLVQIQEATVEQRLATIKQGIDSDIALARQNLDAANKRYDALQGKLDAASERRTGEREGRSGSMIPGEGKEYETVKKEVENLQRNLAPQIQSVNEDIKVNNALLSKRQSERKNEEGLRQKAIKTIEAQKDRNDFVARYIAHKSLIDPKSQFYNPAVAEMHTGISLTFLALELLPVLTKLLFSFWPTRAYEDALDVLEDEARENRALAASQWELERNRHRAQSERKAQSSQRRLDDANSSEFIQFSVRAAHQEEYGASQRAAVAEETTNREAEAAFRTENAEAERALRARQAAQERRLRELKDRETQEPELQVLEQKALQWEADELQREEQHGVLEDQRAANAVLREGLRLRREAEIAAARDEAEAIRRAGREQANAIEEQTRLYLQTYQNTARAYAAAIEEEARHQIEEFRRGMREQIRTYTERLMAEAIAADQPETFADENPSQ